jgi:hypothetical protein
MDGADLYADDGTYYYADTRDGLPAAIAAEKADKNPADDWTFIARDVAAAEAAFTGTTDEARRRMADAAYRPGDKPDLTSEAAAAKRKAILAAKGKPTDVKPISAKAQQDNLIWNNAMEALKAGAGRPAVRAGVLHLLATVDTIKVTKDTDAGRDVLVLTAAVTGDYTEQLTVDAGSGMPIRFTGGDAGRAPSVDITYTVSRVTVADVAKGA